MYTYQVPTQPTIPFPLLRRARTFAIAVALAITLALVITAVAVSSSAVSRQSTARPAPLALRPDFPGK